MKSQYTPNDVEIVSKERLFRGFFQMVKVTFKHKLFAGGWSQPIERELFERGHAAAMLPYDPVRDEVVLIEQVRVGALEQDSPWQFEIVAGIMDAEESVEELVRREAMEEAGVEVNQLSPIANFYPSSGGCTERLNVFVGQVDASTASGIHGLEYENEDIQVHVMSREQAYAMVKNGKIENGASIIALQWLELNREELLSQWQI